MYKDSNSSYSTGTKLKSVREGKGLTLEEISSSLKIDRKFLEAIEEGKYEIVPADVYLRGFVKNYSEFLGLDSQRSLKILKREREYARKVKHSKSPKKEVVESQVKQLKITPGRFFWILVISTIVITGVVTLGKVYMATQRPKLRLNYPIIAEASYDEIYKVDTTTATIKLKGEIDPGNSLYINNNAVETFGLGSFETPEMELKDGENNFELKTRNQFGIENLIAVSIFKNSPDS